MLFRSPLSSQVNLSLPETGLRTGMNDPDPQTKKGDEVCPGPSGEDIEPVEIAARHTSQCLLSRKSQPKDETGTTRLTRPSPVKRGKEVAVVPRDLTTARIEATRLEETIGLETGLDRCKRNDPDLPDQTHKTNQN